MFSAIYIEQALQAHPRVREICQRYPQVPVITCAHYGEVFNRKAQNFRLQKQAPALILAQKQGEMVLPAPAGYGFEQGSGFYFSHMLNCLYDCRYCFLQGMYRSAHYVLFVNYEDFREQLLAHFQTQQSASVYYSGYDCDSLAFEPVSRFCDYFLPLFAEHPQATLELRSKSTQVRKLLEFEPLDNCIVAMSLASEASAARWEAKVPALGKRLDALQRLQKAGWKVALRFEPVIAGDRVIEEYQQLFSTVFAKLDVGALHSVSLGEFRMPSGFYKQIVRLYPDEALFAKPVQTEQGMTALAGGGETLIRELESRLHDFIQPHQYYRCA
jgi:spore photoproduct lyase